jgi:hypothetical protein
MGSFGHLHFGSSLRRCRHARVLTSRTKPEEPQHKLARLVLSLRTVSYEELDLGTPTPRSPQRTMCLDTRSTGGIAFNRFRCAPSV